MKRCVITGAADGIGRALARTFAAHGFAVTGLDLNTELAGRTQRELEESGATVSFIVGDLTDEADRKRAIEKLSEGPPIDVFIHNAGYNEVGRFSGFDPELQRRIVAINFVAPMVLTGEMLRRDCLAASASLVFFSSLSSYIGYPGAAVYAASKQGVASYARSLGVSLGRRGIHVLTVYPGPTRTEMAARCSPLEDERAAERRMAPEQVAEAVLHAVKRRRRVLIPGAKNRMFAFAGRYFPKVTEHVMRRSVFDKLVD